MLVAKKCKVEVKKDHLSKIAAGSPETGLVEMLWNALDADATNVNIQFQEDTFGVDEIRIKDNGTGIKYEDAEDLFVSLGGSWKAQKQKTNQGRFLHGKDGEGRFKAFVLGHVVDWNVVYEKAGKFFSYTIEGRADSIDEFTLTDEQPANGSTTGVEVRITELSKKFHILNKEKAIEKLTPIFALYLSNYPTVNLTISGTQICPDEVIKHREKFSLQPIEEDGISYDIELILVEWNGIKERELWFCDEHGFPLELCNKQIRGTGEFGFSGYLASKYFCELHKKGLLALGELNKKVSQICDQTIKTIKDYFIKRSLEVAKAHPLCQ